MDETSFDVKILKSTIYKSRKGVDHDTHYVRWRVGKEYFSRPFTAGQAESFRSTLVVAAARGEAFRLVDGLPTSAARAEQTLSVYHCAQRFLFDKWIKLAGNSRRSIAEALVPFTIATLNPGKRKPDDKTLRSALLRYGFNKTTHDTAPSHVVKALAWVAANSRPISALADHAVLRTVMDYAATKLDGELYAPTVIGRRRAVLHNLLEYAREQKQFMLNPLTNFKWSAPDATDAIDPDFVINPKQARRLLNAVKTIKHSGPRCYALFALTYYAGLRPEEAIALTRDQITLPELPTNADGNDRVPEGEFGQIKLRGAEPHAGKDWTDTGTIRDKRTVLKHRKRNETRTIPVAPQLVKILRWHIAEFHIAPKDRMFLGVRGEPIPYVTIRRIWVAARKAAFTSEEQATPLAKTPYSLRHAAFSTWLRSGIDPAQVSAWGGVSIKVIYDVYAAVLEGTASEAQRRLRDGYS